jgi:hypothetical protein
MRKLSLMIGGILALVGLFAIPAAAQQGATSRFDHFRTGFPLTGAHLTVECVSCHVNARLKGTPRACAACHNGTLAPGKPANHVMTGSPCETCHTNSVSFAAARFSHAGVTSGCASCHNGVKATGKPAGHIATVAPCETCHKSTVTFVGAAFDHASAPGGPATRAT